jgi:hypothetical protein
MFKSPAVFILGAGASWHYGYPTGEYLVKKIIDKAKVASQYFSNSARASNNRLPEYLVANYSKAGSIEKQWLQAYQDCETLRAGLEQVNPLVIDYYLGWNTGLQKIGQLLIAWVILECEKQTTEIRCNYNRRESFKAIENGLQRKFDPTAYKDGWCRFIIHQLAMHCETSSDLLKNKISFVTFNYDVSLETTLRQGLNYISLFDTAHVDQFLCGSRIVHVYGKVRDLSDLNTNSLNWEVQTKNPTTDVYDLLRYQTEFQEFFNSVYKASLGLRVIDPFDKNTDSENILVARAQIAAANRVYILGYGFDEHNSERLGLQEYLRYSGSYNKSVGFTNFGDINRVNKRASQLFFGNTASFPPGEPPIRNGYEKSVRNVYDALELDFDLPE